jgi:hypothetical protein
MAHTSAIFGIYQNRQSVERAVNALKDSGYRDKDISILSSEETSTMHKKSTKAPEGAATGGSAGALIGATLGWLAGMNVLPIPGRKNFVAAGPILSLLAGAGIIGSLGWIIGALVGMGFPEYEAKRFEGMMKGGGILVAVHADSKDWKNRALDILERTGAADMGVEPELKAA